MLKNRIKPATLLLPLLLASCATFSPDGGFGAVEKTTQNYIKQKPIWANTTAQKQAAAEQLKALLAEPLSVNDAVQIALINNANLQASFYDLQIAEANVVQAGRLPNPIFDMLYAKNGGEFKSPRSRSCCSSSTASIWGALRLRFNFCSTTTKPLSMCC